jgi:hypothetical protein
VSPFAESNVASARKNVEACLEHLRRAIGTEGPEAWRYVAEARNFAITARVELASAVRLEEMAVVAGGGEDE